jgi:biotin carboxyl carrier protein
LARPAPRVPLGRAAEQVVQEERGALAVLAPPEQASQAQPVRAERPARVAARAQPVRAERPARVAARVARVGQAARAGQVV